MKYFFDDWRRFLDSGLSPKEYVRKCRDEIYQEARKTEPDETEIDGHKTLVDRYLPRMTTPESDPSSAEQATGQEVPRTRPADRVHQGFQAPDEILMLSFRRIKPIAKRIYGLYSTEAERMGILEGIKKAFLDQTKEGVDANQFMATLQDSIEKIENWISERNEIPSAGRVLKFILFRINELPTGVRQYKKLLYSPKN